MRSRTTTAPYRKSTPSKRNHAKGTSKTPVRLRGEKRAALSQNPLNRLNKQIALEFYSANLSLQMSAWYDHKGSPAPPILYGLHPNEEMDHMQKISDCILGTGALVNNS